jgi:hypothetical protein
MLNDESTELVNTLAKHDPTAKGTHATIEILLETVFFTRSVQRGYKENNWSKNMQFEWSGNLERT